MINSLTVEYERVVQRGGTFNSLTAECERVVRRRGMLFVHYFT